MREAPSCFWKAFTRPPASSTIAASAWALRSPAEAKAPSMLRLAAMTLLFAVVGASAAAAEQVYSFDRTPGRLPKTVIPIHYAIELEPDLENLTLAGSEVVDIEVREPTDRLVLNAVGMTLSA